MKRTCLLAAMLVATATPAFAQNGNGAPSGSHYTLNILGKDKDKQADMTGSNRHTIFVALYYSDPTPTDPTPLVDLSRKNKIYLSEGPFQVVDGNAWDGAEFKLPAPGCEVLGITAVDGCDYSVWVRGLGGPNSKSGTPYANITTCGIDDGGSPGMTGDDTFQCSTESVHVERNRGKSTFYNVTKELLTLCLDTVLDATVKCDTRVQLFSSDFYQYFWDYDNYGLRLAQLRFYPKAPVK